MRLTVVNNNVIFSMQIKKQQRRQTPERRIQEAKATAQGCLVRARASYLAVLPNCASIFGNAAFHSEKENEFKKVIKNRPGSVGVYDPFGGDFYARFRKIRMGNEQCQSSGPDQPLGEPVEGRVQYRFQQAGKLKYETKQFWAECFRIRADCRRGGGRAFSNEYLCPAFNTSEFKGD